MLPAALLGVVLSAGCTPDGSSRAPSAVDHYVVSQMLLEEGRIDEALEELAQAIEADPDLAVSYEATADIHRRQGSYLMAERHYRQAVHLAPLAFRPHYNLAVTYQALADAAMTVRHAAEAAEYLQQAIRTYLRAATIDENDFDTYLNLSSCYFQLGKYDLAEQYCKSAIKLQPSSPQAYSNLGVIYDAQGELYAAIRAYKTSLELDTHQPKLLLNLGSTYMRQGSVGYKRARRAFELAAAEDPNDPEPLVRIGLVEFKLTEYDKALAAYRRAVEIDPRSAAAHRGIGTVLMTQWVLEPERTELRDDALSAWTTSLELAPEQPKLEELVRKYTPDEAPPEL
jgi:tetratricopeptide (TPR) repeat protein